MQRPPTPTPPPTPARRLRPMTPEDADAAAALFAAARDADGLAGWTAAALRQTLADRGFGAVVHGADGAIVGAALALYAGDDADVAHIAVTPAARRTGVARQLIAALAAAAREAGFARLALEVAVDNSPALGLYAGFGFTAVGCRPGYYRRENGSVGAKVMALDLSAATKLS